MIGIESYLLLVIYTVTKRPNIVQKMQDKAISQSVVSQAVL